MPVAYEWVAEIVVADDIIDADYYPIDDLDAALAWGRYTVEVTPRAGLRVGLVRYVLNAEGEEQSRDYAYAEDGELAETFEDSARDVPARFRTMYRRAPARPLPVR
jgi:hypothetical protein